MISIRHKICKIISISLLILSIVLNKLILRAFKEYIDQKIGLTPTIKRINYR